MSRRHLHKYLPEHLSKDNDNKTEGSRIDVRLRTYSISSPCTQLGMCLWNSMMWVGPQGMMLCSDYFAKIHGLSITM